MPEDPGIVADIAGGVDGRTERAAVNYSGLKFGGRRLAPQVGFGSEQGIDNIGSYWFYCNASNVFGQKCLLCTTDLSHVTVFAPNRFPRRYSASNCIAPSLQLRCFQLLSMFDFPFDGPAKFKLKLVRQGGYDHRVDG